MIYFALFIIFASGVAVGAIEADRRIARPPNYKAICHICGTLAEGPDMGWVKSVLEFHGPCHKRTELKGAWHSPEAAS